MPRPTKIHLSRTEIETTIRLYGGGAIEQAHRIQNVVMNSVYRVDTSLERLILKVYEWQDAKAVEEEVTLLRHLRCKSFPCPEVKTTVTGEAISFVQDQPVLVFPYIEGIEVANPADVTEAHLYNAGRTMAEFHLATTDFHFERCFCDLENIALMLDELQQSWASDADFTTMASREYQRFLSSTIVNCPRGIIHTDLYPAHILFSDGNSEVKAVLDFEGACEGFLMFDLAAMINFWTYMPRGFNFDGLRTMLSGYNDVRRISPDEERALESFMEYAALYWAVWRHHYFTLVLTDRTVFSDYREYAIQLQQIKEQKEQLVYHIGLALST